MRHSPNTPDAGGPDLHRILTYVADLELEVDRLRKQAEFLYHEVQETVRRVQLVCTEATQADESPAPLAVVQHATSQLGAALRDLHESPGFHPAYDQVVPIALRPLAEQVFRWQQRLMRAPQAVLHLELESEYLEWFPARLRNILDNLLSNALKYRDAVKEESWVRLALRTLPQGYELRVSDNGVGLPPRDLGAVFDLFYRAAPARAAGLGVGLAVVKLLVEQSGGTLTVDSGEGQGTTFVALLPRYDVADFLT